MKDVKLVKTLELKKSGRPKMVVTEDDENKFLAVLKNKKLSKKEVIAQTGLKPGLVAKFLQESPMVTKLGSLKGTKYTVL